MSDTRGSERLLIEVKRLEAEVERLRAELVETAQAHDAAEASYDWAMGELVRLHRIEKAARELLTRVSPDWTTALRAALKESA